jgi:DNA-binding NarL/FixJ family response regulator
MNGAHVPKAFPAPDPESAVADRRAGTAETVTTVAIVERDHVIREGLRALVQKSPDLCCLAAHASIREALLALPEFQPDVMLLDGQLLAQNQTGLIARLKARSPTSQILVLTTFDLGGVSLESVLAGASGDLPKTTPAAELVQAVKWVHAGGSLMSMALARRVRSHFRAHQAREGGLCALTGREEEVVAALARGNRYPVIADRFGLDVSALLGLLRGVYAKLGDLPRVT